jgi:hypothetical protein
MFRAGAPASPDFDYERHDDVAVQARQCFSLAADALTQTGGDSDASERGGLCSAPTRTTGGESRQDFGASRCRSALSRDLSDPRAMLVRA